MEKLLSGTYREVLSNIDDTLHNVVCEERGVEAEALLSHITDNIDKDSKCEEDKGKLYADFHKQSHSSRIHVRTAAVYASPEPLKRRRILKLYASA